MVLHYRCNLTAKRISPQYVPFNTKQKFQYVTNYNTRNIIYLNNLKHNLFKQFEIYFKKILVGE